MGRRRLLWRSRGWRTSYVGARVAPVARRRPARARAIPGRGARSLATGRRRPCGARARARAAPSPTRRLTAARRHRARRRREPTPLALLAPSRPRRPRAAIGVVGLAAVAAVAVARNARADARSSATAPTPPPPVRQRHHQVNDNVLRVHARGAHRRTRWTVPRARGLDAPIGMAYNVARQLLTRGGRARVDQPRRAERLARRVPVQRRLRLRGEFGAARRSPRRRGGCRGAIASRAAGDTAERDARGAPTQLRVAERARRTRSSLLPTIRRARAPSTRRPLAALRRRASGASTAPPPAPKRRSAADDRPPPDAAAAADRRRHRGAVDGRRRARTTSPAALSVHRRAAAPRAAIAGRPRRPTSPCSSRRARRRRGTRSQRPPRARCPERAPPPRRVAKDGARRRPGGAAGRGWAVEVYEMVMAPAAELGVDASGAVGSADLGYSDRRGASTPHDSIDPMTRSEALPVPRADRRAGRLRALCGGETGCGGGCGRSRTAFDGLLVGATAGWPLTTTSPEARRRRRRWRASDGGPSWGTRSCTGTASGAVRWSSP